MLWMERIAACVREAIDKRAGTLVDLAVAADVSATTLDGVRFARPGTGVMNVEKVVRALGLQIVADCVQANAEWQEGKERLLASLREKSQMDWDAKDAEELLHLCDYLIKAGKAKGAVEALGAWRFGGTPAPYGKTGAGRPLA
jgi:hypothetical protein